MAARAMVLLAALAVGVLFAVGLFVAGPLGGVLVLATLAVLVAVTRSVWATLSPEGRRLRVALIVVLAAVAAVKLAGVG